MKREKENKKIKIREKKRSNSNNWSTNKQTHQTTHRTISHRRISLGVYHSISTPRYCRPDSHRAVHGGRESGARGASDMRPAEPSITNQSLTCMTELQNHVTERKKYMNVNARECTNVNVKKHMNVNKKQTHERKYKTKPRT